MIFDGMGGERVVTATTTFSLEKAFDGVENLFLNTASKVWAFYTKANM